MDILTAVLSVMLIVMLVFVSFLLLIAMTLLTKIYRFVSGLLGPIFNLFKSPW